MNAGWNDAAQLFVRKNNSKPSQSTGGVARKQDENENAPSGEDMRAGRAWVIDRLVGSVVARPDVVGEGGCSEEQVCPAPAAAFGLSPAGLM